MTDEASEGSWRWLDTGLSVATNFWYPTYPRHNVRSERYNCALLIMRGSTVYWQDYACYAGMRFLCEKP